MSKLNSVSDATAIEGLNSVVLNDEQPIEFADFNEVVSSSSHFRESNIIYMLQLFRVKNYSL